MYIPVDSVLSQKVSGVVTAVVRKLARQSTWLCRTGQERTRHFSTESHQKGWMLTIIRVNVSFQSSPRYDFNNGLDLRNS